MRLGRITIERHGDLIRRFTEHYRTRLVVLDRRLQFAICGPLYVGWHRPAPAEPAAQAPAWMNPRIELLDSTDWKTASRLFAPLRSWTVRLTTRTERKQFDVRVIDPSHIVDAADADHEVDHRAGFLVVPVDDDGEVSGAEVFVPYEDIDAIGVY